MTTASILSVQVIVMSHLLDVALKELQILDEIGQGAFGHVYKAIWRGAVVAAKEIRISGNKKMLENELSVYRYVKQLF